MDIYPTLRGAGLGILFLTLGACGSSKTEPETPDPEVDTPTVGVQGGECQLKRLLSDVSGDEQCEPGAIESLTSGAALSGSVATGAEVVYRVPSGAEIILTSQSGNADLYLMTTAEYSDDALVCNGASPYREDNCTATANDGELYALVYGREAATYTLTATTDCSVASVNEWVYRNMRDYYLYADRVPVVNPVSYESPGQLVRDLRFEELDPYSNVQDAVTQQAFQESGAAFGFGFRWKPDADGNARVARVYDNSPFGRQGIKRSDIIVSINGEFWSEMTNERYQELTGSRDNPLTSNWEIVDGTTGESSVVPIQIGEYTANTVLFANSYSNENFNGSVGYLVFEGFIRTSEADLDFVIGELQSSGVTELVLDLRYNPGGLISIANRLASQIAGPAVQNQTLVRYQYNNRYTDQNFDFDAEDASPSLDLNRVIVLTTERTASASELVINSLRPFIEVITIGEKTVGKAFISAPKLFCGKSLNAMEAEGVNANGVSVAGGIPADCYAADDVTRDFGNQSGSTEGMLAASLDYLLNGTCAVSPVFAKRPVTSDLLPGDQQPLPGAILDQ